MATITIEIPDKWDKYLDQYVKNGWAMNKEEVFKDAIKRYIDSHKEEIIEGQIMQDIEWGLSK